MSRPLVSPSGIFVLAEGFPRATIAAEAEGAADRKTQLMRALAAAFILLCILDLARAGSTIVGAGSQTVLCLDKQKKERRGQRQL